MAAVAVSVKFFASGRELAGTDGFVLQLPEDDANTEAVTRVRLPPPPQTDQPLPATTAPAVCLPVRPRRLKHRGPRVFRCVRW